MLKLVNVQEINEDRVETVTKKTVQVAFAGDANLTTVETQLKELVKDESIEKVICCFLPRHIVIEKGFPTYIDDLLESVLGDKLVWKLADCKTFDEAMAALPSKRKEMSEEIDALYILDGQSAGAKGVLEEIVLFAKQRGFIVVK